jgi:hypothetical protein
MPYYHSHVVCGQNLGLCTQARLAKRLRCKVGAEMSASLLLGLAEGNFTWAEECHHAAVVTTAEVGSPPTTFDHTTGQRRSKGLGNG